MELNYYLLTTDGRAAIKKLINPKRIIAVHIQPWEAAEAIEHLQKADPVLFRLQVPSKRELFYWARRGFA